MRKGIIESQSLVKRYNFSQLKLLEGTLERAFCIKLASTQKKTPFIFWLKSYRHFVVKAKSF